MTELFKKLNFKAHPEIHILHAPASFQSEMEAMSKVTALRTELANSVSFALCFATKQSEVDHFADQLALAASSDTASDAVVWIAYPKGTSKQYKCEFNRDNGWARMAAHGYEPVRMVAIDADWSALRFRRVEHIKTMTRSFALTEAGKQKARQNKK